MKKLLLLFLLACFCHCHSPKSSPDTLSIVLNSEPTSLDPRKATDANGMRLVNLLFHGLIQLGPELNTVADGASKWSQKGLKYSFSLKPLSFSNGRSLTKEDLLFTFQEFRKTSSPFYSAFKKIRLVQVTGKAPLFVVHITLKSPSATFLSADLPIIKILPKKETLALGTQFQKKPIGTGEFVLKKNNQKELLLERRSSSPLPKPQYLSFLIVRDSFTRVQKILSGAVDVAPSVIPPEKIFLFKQKKKFQIFSTPGLSTTYLLLNLKNPYLKNLAIRKALAHSINRKDIIKYKLKGYGIAATSFLNPHHFFFNPQLKNPEFNIGKAQKILKKWQIPKISFTCSNNSDTINKAKVLVSQMSQSGLKVSLETYEWGVFYDDLKRGLFDIALMQWVGVIDPDIYNVAFHSKNLAPQGRNRSFYVNKKLDSLLEAGVKEMNKKTRKKIYNQVQQIIHDDLAVIPLWHNMEISILKQEIKEYILPKNGSFNSLNQVKKY